MEQEMTNIVILKSMTMCNFRGIESKTINFNPKETTISGRNKAGKSRIMNAFLWALSGKDAEGNTDNNIRTEINNEILHHVECSVELVLEINGYQTTIKREQAEIWVKPRGETEKIFKGNETKIWWDGTPLTVKEYNDKISKIFPEDSLLILTRLYHFFELDWKQQRELLMKLSGGVSDNDVVNADEKFKELSVELQKSRKTPQELLNSLKFTQKKLEDEVEEIDIRIDQTEKNKPKALDFDAIQEEIGTLEDELAEINVSIANDSSSLEVFEKALAEKRSKIDEIKKEKDSIINEQKDKAQEEFDKKIENKRSLLVKKALTSQVIASSITATNALEKQKKSLENSIEEKKARRDELRESWTNVSAKEFCSICSNCGQEIPAELYDKLREEFFINKNSLIKQIEVDGKALKNNIEQSEKELEEATKRINELQCLMQEKQKELDDVSKKIEDLGEITKKEVLEADIQRCVEINNEITALQQEIDSEQAPEKSNLEIRKEEIEDLLKGKREEFGNKKTIDDANQTIKNLQEEGKEKAQSIADIEKQEMLVRNFIKDKVSIVQSRVNDLFTRVSFSLFTYNIEDYYKENPKECCTPLVDGVRYTTSNTASQVNACIEVIRVFQNYFNVKSPVFVDRAESVNEIAEADTQVVKLRVTEEEQLTVR